MANGGSGFVSILFDFSFSEFITTKIIKFLYGLAIAVGALWMIFILFTGSYSYGYFGRGLGFLSFLIAPIGFIIWVILARVWLELVIVAFRTVEYLSEIAAQGRKK